MNSEVFLLLLLCIAVPLQYILSEYFSPEDVNSTREFGTGGLGYLKDILLVTSLSKVALVKVASFVLGGGRRFASSNEVVEEETSPAHEVFEFNYFANGAYIRKHRGNAKYRIGQVVRHRQQGYVGVVFGWDLEARAPQEWYNRNKVLKSERKQPFYKVLVDPRYVEGQENYVTYAMESNLILVDNDQVRSSVKHKSMKVLFTHYHTGMKRYIPNSKLHMKYPAD